MERWSPRRVFQEPLVATERFSTFFVRCQFNLLCKKFKDPINLQVRHISVTIAWYTVQLAMTCSAAVSVCLCLAGYIELGWDQFAYSTNETRHYTFLGH